MSGFEREFFSFPACSRVKSNINVHFAVLLATELERFLANLTLNLSNRNFQSEFAPVNSLYTRYYSLPHSELFNAIHPLFTENRFSKFSSLLKHAFYFVRAYSKVTTIYQSAEKTPHFITQYCRNYSRHQSSHDNNSNTKFGGNLLPLHFSTTNIYLRWRSIFHIRVRRSTIDCKKYPMGYPRRVVKALIMSLRRII